MGLEKGPSCGSAPESSAALHDQASQRVKLVREALVRLACVDEVARSLLVTRKYLLVATGIYPVDRVTTVTKPDTPPLSTRHSSRSQPEDLGTKPKLELSKGIVTPTCYDQGMIQTS